MAEDAERFMAAVARTARVEFTIGGEQRVAPDWAAPPRTLPWHLVYFVTRHAFVGQVCGRAVRVDAGSLLWVMPGVPHAFWIEPGEPAFSVCYFRVGIDPPSAPGASVKRRLGSERATHPSDSASGQKTPAERIHFIANGVNASDTAPLRLVDDFLLVEEAWEAGQLVRQIVDELPSNLPFEALRLRALLVMLFTSAMRVRDRRQDGGHSLSRSQRVRLTRLARRHATERLSPGDLAAELDLSPDYFTRLFRKSFGLSPRAWLVDQRLRHAAGAMLNSNRSVSQIAGDYGYADVFLFSRQFKQVLGMGPLAYRRSQGGHADRA
jgi:AraC-like DNA-binding protein